VSIFDLVPREKRKTFDSLWPSSVRRFASLALIIIGLGLLGYVGIEYWGMYRSQQNLEAEWERQAAGTNTPGHASISPDHMLTRVIIPKINMDAVLIEGVSRKALSAGPGHMKETAMPGETGNAVITGHRDTFFRHIYELAKGDEIQVRRNGRVFTFEVTGQRIVQPDDVSVLKQTNDPQLTLITCYPTYYIGPAPQRLVVFSRLIGSSDYGQPSKQAQAHGGQ
jgi:sortase A